MAKHLRNHDTSWQTMKWQQPRSNELDLSFNKGQVLYRYFSKDVKAVLPTLGPQKAFGEYYLEKAVGEPPEVPQTWLQKQTSGVWHFLSGEKTKKPGWCMLKWKEGTTFDAYYYVERNQLPVCHKLVEVKL